MIELTDQQQRDLAAEHEHPPRVVNPHGRKHQAQELY